MKEKIKELVSECIDLKDILEMDYHNAISVKYHYYNDNDMYVKDTKIDSEYVEYLDILIEILEENKQSREYIMQALSNLESRENEFTEEIYIIIKETLECITKIHKKFMPIVLDKFSNYGCRTNFSDITSYTEEQNTIIENNLRKIVRYIYILDPKHIIHIRKKVDQKLGVYMLI